MSKESDNYYKMQRLDIDLEAKRAQVKDLKQLLAESAWHNKVIKAYKCHCGYKLDATRSAWHNIVVMYGREWPYMRRNGSPNYENMLFVGKGWLKKHLNKQELTNYVAEKLTK